MFLNYFKVTLIGTNERIFSNATRINCRGRGLEIGVTTVSRFWIEMRRYAYEQPLSDQRVETVFAM